jgi:hypothetical protein
MRIRIVGAGALLAAWLTPVGAAAQERGQAGVTMGYPAQFGFLWHASDNLAIRPELSIVHASTESTTSVLGITSSHDSTGVSAGASVLWYFEKRDSVRTYFAPRLAFSHTTSDTAGVGIPTATSVSASFGAQYTPVRRFAVFGEVGYGVTRSSYEASLPIGTSEYKSTAWAPRGSVGVILYFGK